MGDGRGGVRGVAVRRASRGLLAFRAWAWGGRAGGVRLPGEGGREMTMRGLVIAAAVLMGLGSAAWAQQPAPARGGPMGPGTMGQHGGGIMMGGQAQPGMPGMMMGGMGMGRGMMGMGPGMMGMGRREATPFDRPLISII